MEAKKKLGRSTAVVEHFKTDAACEHVLQFSVKNNRLFHYCYQLIKNSTGINKFSFFRLLVKSDIPVAI